MYGSFSYHAKVTVESIESASTRMVEVSPTEIQLMTAE